MRGLVKAYGSTRVVDGLSFDVEAGTVCALLGPNGAGKTTTVECLEGFRVPDGGSVRVLGLDPRRQRGALVQRMGVMLQEGGAWQAATPSEMLSLYAKLYPRSRDPRELLERMGLTSAARSRYRTLSGGQKQRLNLALALVGCPEVVMLDEPTAGLDPQARQATWDLVRGLRDDGVTVLLTTHFMDEAERLADLAVVIDQGRLLAAGSPAQLIAGDAPDQVVVMSSGKVDVDALSARLGTRVVREAAGRYLIEAGPEAIPVVTAWFADHGLPLTGVSVGERGLEDVFLRLTGRKVRE